VDEETQSDRPLGETIERRGSLREYSHEPISDRKFATVLDRALRGAPTDCSGDVEAGARAPGRLIDCYCLVHAVDGIDQGAYQYHPEENVLERLGDTDRETAGRLALGQGVVGDAAVNVYLMADVDAIVDAVGNRGYRLAQLEGGISLGRLYLATYAHLALGGRGFTFFDDEVTQHLLPRSGDQTPMTLFAFGKPEGKPVSCGDDGLHGVESVDVGCPRAIGRRMTNSAPPYSLESSTDTSPPLASTIASTR